MNGFPPEPNPFPALREGLAIGAPEHRGFIAAWNWMADIMRRAAECFCLGVNGRTGRLCLIGGEGIDVTVSGRTICVSLGSGVNTDADATASDGTGGGASPHSPVDSGWTDAEPPEHEAAASIGGDAGMFKWDAASGTMGPGGVMVGRRWKEATLPASGGDGTYSLLVEFGAGGGVTATVVKEDAADKTATSTKCWIPIYTVSGGKVTEDLRGAFVVPCWE